MPSRLAPSPARQLPPAAAIPPGDRVETLAMAPVPVPASEMFCQPSRLANIYEPGVERVHQPAMAIPGEAVTVSIRHGTTLPHARLAPLGWRGRLFSRLEACLRGRCLDLKERLAYDARPVFNNNMAHLVQHHLGNLGLLKARFGCGPGDILVVMEGRPPPLAVEVFSLLGYEVLPTSLPVRANLAEVAVEHFFHLLPQVAHLDFRGWVGGGPEKVFIPRKVSRRLKNEAQVEAMLKEAGFEKVYFEDISIPEQWSLLRGASDVAAIHGAALGCLAFQFTRRQRRRPRLLEFFGPGFVVNPYRKYMAVLGGTWAGCRGRITPEVVRDIDRPGRLKDHAFDDFDLSTAALGPALAYLLAPRPE